MLQATSPDGTRTVTYTGKRKGVRWATWAKFKGESEWSHFGWSSSPTRQGAIKAGRSTNHYAEHYDATPANEHHDETAPAVPMSDWRTDVVKQYDATREALAKGMTRVQARRAMSTLEDIWTDEGDAVVIDCARISVRKGRAGVRVTGHGDGPYGQWFPLDHLTAKEDL